MLRLWRKNLTIIITSLDDITDQNHNMQYGCFDL